MVVSRIQALVNHFTGNYIATIFFQEMGYPFENLKNKTILDFH